MAEMTAKDYLETKARMTHKCQLPDCCKMCPLSSYNNGLDIGCQELEYNSPDKAIAIVQKWGEEHPKKTRLTEFMRLFPNAELNKVYPVGCIRVFDSDKKCNVDPRNCSDCMSKFWNEEIKDETD